MSTEPGAAFLKKQSSQVITSGRVHISGAHGGSRIPRSPSPSPSLSLPIVGQPQAAAARCEAASVHTSHRDQWHRPSGRIVPCRRGGLKPQGGRPTWRLGARWLAMGQLPRLSCYPHASGKLPHPVASSRPAGGSLIGRVGQSPRCSVDLSGPLASFTCDEAPSLRCQPDATSRSSEVRSTPLSFLVSVSYCFRAASM